MYTNNEKESTVSTHRKQNLVGSNALLDLFVKTGLTFIFSVIKQNWDQPAGILIF